MAAEVCGVVWCALRVLGEATVKAIYWKTTTGRRQDDKKQTRVLLLFAARSVLLPGERAR